MGMSVVKIPNALEQEPYRLTFASTVADQFTKRVMFSQEKSAGKLECL